LNIVDTTETNRIHELEDGLKEAERRVAEMRAERDEARDLVQRMEEHVEDADATIEQWKDAFAMELDDNGLWAFSDNLMKRYDSLLDDHNAQTNLGLQTVRTILGRQLRTDRTSINRLQKFDPDNAALAAARARKRTRDALPSVSLRCCTMAPRY